MANLAIGLAIGFLTGVVASFAALKLAAGRERRPPERIIHYEIKT